ncbi:50S ribosomal protein L24 [Candidatus Marinimicrobia bacterium]|nr:50S ribosomal protein L24 [Candidatus Neomarinimicrobiota bacterium]
MNKIKKEDTVKVLAGSYKGESGRVVKIIKEKNRAIVEGINKAKKHIRPTQDNPQGGIIEKELSINLSNLGLMNKGKLVKVGFGIDKAGKRHRINKKNGNKID